MGHATEIITVDVYGDKKEIISDCLEELEPFINSVLPKVDKFTINDFSSDEELINSIEQWITSNILITL